MVGDFAHGALRAANPDPQPRIVTRAQVLLNRFQPMMPAAGALRPESDFSERQIRIVHHQEQSLERRPEIFPQSCHRYATLVHVGLRLAQH